MSNDVEVSAKRLRAVQGKAIRNGQFCFKCQQSCFDTHNCPEAGMPGHTLGDMVNAVICETWKTLREMETITADYVQVTGVEGQLREIKDSLTELRKDVSVIKKNTRPLTDKLLGKE